MMYSVQHVVLPRRSQSPTHDSRIIVWWTQSQVAARSCVPFTGRRHAYYSGTACRNAVLVGSRVRFNRRLWADNCYRNACTAGQARTRPARLRAARTTSHARVRRGDGPKDDAPIRVAYALSRTDVNKLPCAAHECHKGLSKIANREIDYHLWKGFCFRVAQGLSTGSTVIWGRHYSIMKRVHRFFVIRAVAPWRRKKTFPDF